MVVKESLEVAKETRIPFWDVTAVNQSTVLPSADYITVSSSQGDHASILSRNVNDVVSQSLPGDLL